VPDLAVWKDFLRFQASTMRGKIEERPYYHKTSCWI
jgi:hypothetical protein